MSAPVEEYRVRAGTSVAHIQRLRPVGVAAYEVHTLCGGMRGLLVVNAGNLPWPVDPFAKPVDLSKSWARPCAKCQAAYDRARIARTPPP